MTANETRQSFLDFFAEKEHTIVPSAPLLPSSPNLLFTNAGMNQFIPYFLGTEKTPYSPPRATDTQKCIRAGGKHNDLEDVGFDTYHHTFFEMLGNWSFGDYFKKEAISWAWELVVERWGFPPERIYATVYSPDEGDPAEFDQEAYDFWKVFFEKAGLDPSIHIVNGNKKDNFWMMGDTGPCGPCSELHIDLTEKGDTKGSLVNKDHADCIEIWNLVFIQYNAEADGSFRPLPAQHVDTGMGFERVAGIIQSTKNFTDFSNETSNYDSDVFTPIFNKISDLTGKEYHKTLPSGDNRQCANEQEEIDVAFRVISDHIRTLIFSIADGIRPGNNDRNYVIKRILRRAVRYGRQLGLEKGSDFLATLTPVVIENFQEAFPELKAKEKEILETLSSEETQFNKTLDRGLQIFEKASQNLKENSEFPAETAFELYDTYGFPIDLTKLMLDERGIQLNEGTVEDLMTNQRERARKAHSEGKQTVKATDISSDQKSTFVGFDQKSLTTTILESGKSDGTPYIVVEQSPFYLEKGGQVADTGTAKAGSSEVQVIGSIESDDALVLLLQDSLPAETKEVELQLDLHKRDLVEKHHTATHILHWALHEVINKDISQQGSSVDENRLRFDFNSDALKADQITTINETVNQKITAHDNVSWTEVEHQSIKDREDIMQFFGDKYGNTVRVVQIGGENQKLDGYSMELCGGTHVTNTSDCELFYIKSEGAISSGVRRIEALCGAPAKEYIAEQINTLYSQLNETQSELSTLDSKYVSKTAEIPFEASEAQASDIKVIESTLASLKNQNETLKKQLLKAKKEASKAESAQLSSIADTFVDELLKKPFVIEKLDSDNPALLQEVLLGFKKKQYPNLAVLVLETGGKAQLGVYSGDSASKTANEVLQELAPLIEARGGGKDDIARGAGSKTEGIQSLLTEAEKAFS